ncbi:MAG: serine/threonine protein kinase [Alphaproteobacteria bacterium]|nr:serine/threonine protein kinase [Alphaproteobacteria bacterium]
MELAPGTMVDKYVVEELLGRGGMASVYRIRHKSLRSVHALKVLDLPSRQIRERLQSEGMYQANLRHPNVVSVVDVVSIDGSPALVMEYVDGPSLDGLLRVHRPTIEQIDEVARGILKGVRAAHRVGLIHRDLKPANVLMARTDDGFTPKIADFGLAKMTQGDGSNPGRTRTGAMMGTPAYMAPEQFRSAKEVDERADVYALGVTLYELCTGRRPVQSDDLFDIYEQVKAGTFPHPTELVPELPERMEKAILGALVVDPDKRTPSVDALYATWVGLEELASDRGAAWDRSLLDSVSSSAVSGLSGGGSAGSAQTPQTWQTGLVSGHGEGSLATDPPPQRRSSFARRAAPFVAVMGLALTMMLVVGGTGVGGLVVMSANRGVAPASMDAGPAAEVGGEGMFEKEDGQPPPPAPMPAAAPRQVDGPPPGLGARTNQRPAITLPKTSATPQVANEQPLAEEAPTVTRDETIGLADQAAGGAWTLSSDHPLVLVDDAEHVFAPGPVPAGHYRLTDGTPDGAVLLELDVVEGQQVAVRCADGSCSVAP